MGTNSSACRTPPAPSTQGTCHNNSSFGLGTSPSSRAARCPDPPLVQQIPPGTATCPIGEDRLHAEGTGRVANAPVPRNLTTALYLHADVWSIGHIGTNPPAMGIRILELSGSWTYLATPRT